MKKSYMILIAVLSVLFITACDNSDELSGKTFDVSVISSLTHPDRYTPIMRLEFSDGNIVKNRLREEEGTYELIEDQLVLQFENENELLEIEFTLKESDKDISEYSAELSRSTLDIEDSTQLSEFQILYSKTHNQSFVEFIER